MSLVTDSLITRWSRVLQSAAGEPLRSRHVHVIRVVRAEHGDDKEVGLHQA